MPIVRNSFIQMSKLPNVKGRINYISSHARQENLYAVYETIERKFWSQLAACNQEEFIKSGTAGTCIEARELIIALPEEFVQYDPNEMLKMFTEHFKKEYSAECIAALHHNKRKTNYHIHLIFSERNLLEEPEEKIATRNMFYNENGKHVRTKKEILDKDGNVRTGCKIIKKGDVYEKTIFSKKNERFKSENFLEQAKHSYTDLINSFVQDEKNKLAVFDKNGVYLPTKKIGKNNPKAEEIAADNEVRKKWNGTVDHALVSGFDEPRILEIKQKEITNKTRESIIANGKNPELFADIILKAIALLQSVLSAYISRNKVPFPKRPDKAEDSGSVNAVGASQTPRDTPITSEKVKELEEPKLSKLGAKYERLSKIYGKLKKQNARIWSKENDVKILEQELADSTGIFKAIKRRELQDSIDILNVEIEQLKAGLEPIVEMYGYENVKSFMDEYNASKAAYEAYQDAYAKWKNPPKPSARKKLEEKKVESKNIDAARNKTKNKNHNASHDDD